MRMPAPAVSVPLVIFVPAATLAILNDVVWRTQSTDLWVKFKTFGFLPITLLFALAQAPLIIRYEAREKETAAYDF